MGTYDNKPNIKKTIELIPGMLIDSYYGDSFYDDGTDTFGLEYYCLRKLGLIPIEFTTGEFEYIYKNPLHCLPDFAFCPRNDPHRYRNEDASRFASHHVYDSEGTKTDCERDLIETSHFLSELANVRKRKGDPGRTFYKTPEAQVFANAALWKLSQLRLEAFKKELKIKREFSENEIIFWSKAFFNGGQGSQAGVFKMMTSYHDHNIFENSDYLSTWPRIGSPEIYYNARITLDTLLVTDESCIEKIPKKTKKSYTKAGDYKNRLPTSSTSSKKEVINQ